MATATWVKAAAWAAAASVLLIGASAEASDEREYTGLRVHLDNDLFAGSGSDRDYTGGLGVTLSGTAARDGMLSLDPLLAWFDALSANESAEAPAEIHYARQFGLMAFTPKDIPQYDDRPYASLLFIANGRVRVDPDRRGAWSSNLTIGVLGLPVSEQLQSAIHAVVGSEKPRGYDHQISDGGEPTARYSLARHLLWIANPDGTMDVKTTVQGSIGYLTEASVGISMRIGRFDTPWWSFAPELTDYMAAPVPIVSSHGRAERYFFAGARVKARAYNAFLQGQFRHSDVRYSFSEIEPILFEAWLGLVVQLLNQTHLSYTLNYQTEEIRDGLAERDAWWGAVQIVHTF